MPLLAEVEGHCDAVCNANPPNPKFLDECLRGYVLHLSAHFQGFCRDLYSECTQAWIVSVPVAMRASAQSQFSIMLQLDKGNPSYENIRKDFGRFGVPLDLRIKFPTSQTSITDLGHLNDWRNKAAHQRKEPMTSGAPQNLGLSVVQNWMKACDDLASQLDATMRNILAGILGAPPWI